MRRPNLNSRVGRTVRPGIKILPLLLAGWLLICSPGGGCGPSGPPVFDGEAAFDFLEEQCRIGLRYPGSREHRLLQRYLADKLKDFRANVSLQPFEGVLSTGDTLHLINIISNYNREAKKRILLGAHYDTRPVADRDPDPANRLKPIPGANDGASGVAVLLEIARLLGEHKPPVGVDIILFDGEDYGEADKAEDFCLGSSYFARHLKGYWPASVIIVDMVGKKDLVLKKEAYSDAYSSDLLEEIFSVAHRMGISEFRDEVGPSIIDDHLPFIRAGIPSVDLIDFDYRYWHTIQDTPDKCSPRSLEAVGRVLLEYIWQQGS
ncbi:MAG: M28 family peptidase [Candidatus Krumholzibacteriota bacterium]|nr:M28 family peptidase [Candidatus Krumholzibacteriota bacterium]